MKNKKLIWIAVLIVSLLIIAACAIFLYMTLKDSPEIPYATVSSETEATAAPAQEETVSTETAAQPATELKPFGYEMSGQEENTTLSFDELMEINHDIYAWIYIPNTAVDYPVVQSILDGDDTFYLDHNIYREYQFSGSIYSETQNSTRFDDPVTVLYGHNMLNGSMFASLHNFEDINFFNENNTIFIFTQDKVITYFIYAAYTFDDRHILNSYNMMDEDVFREYLDSTLEPRSYNCNIRPGVELTTEDRILTLSTCSNGGGNTRYLVQGVKVDEQRRE
ncbi:MAG: class B sortase [Ruminococcus sp.]|nr:class B sortase [Ruminococcus sp.]